MGLFSKDIQTFDDLFLYIAGHLLCRNANPQIPSENDQKGD